MIDEMGTPDKPPNRLGELPEQARPPASNAPQAYEEELLINSLERASSYVTTNGTISISTFGLYLTVVAALISFAYSSHGPKEIVLGPILSAISVLVLPVCANLYTWIFEQLSFVEIYGSIRKHPRRIISYEDFYAECFGAGETTEEWRSHLRRHGVFCCKHALPFSGIYSVYFSTFLITPHVTLGIALSRMWKATLLSAPSFSCPDIKLLWHVALIFVQFTVLFYSLRQHYRFCEGFDALTKANVEEKSNDSVD